MLAVVLRLQQLGERGEKGPGSEGSVARARGDKGLPRYGPSANTGMCCSELVRLYTKGYQQEGFDGEGNGVASVTMLTFTKRPGLHADFYKEARPPC